MSSIFLFLYGECVYQMIEMYILAYLVHMYKCQSTSLSKDAHVRDGDELKSFWMHVCVCVSVCLEDCSKSRPLCVLRLLHQTSSLDLLEPSAKIEESSQVKRSMKKPCYHQGRTAEQRSFSHLFEIRHAIQLFNLDASNPTLL